MKFLVAVALFAFVAVQLSHAAPAPEEEKKAEVPVAKVVAADPVPAAPVVPVAEVKAAVPPVDVAAAPAAPVEAAKPVEEKKA